MLQAYTSSLAGMAINIKILAALRKTKSEV